MHAPGSGVIYFDIYLTYQLRSTISPEQEVKEHSNTNSDGDANEVVHVFAAAHFNFNILWLFLHLMRLIKEGLAFLPCLFEKLTTRSGLLEVFHDDILCLLKLDTELAYFTTLLWVIVPIGDPLVHLWRKLYECWLGVSCLERLIQNLILLRLIGTLTGVHVQSGIFTKYVGLNVSPELVKELLALLLVDLVRDNNSRRYCVPIMVEDSEPLRRGPIGSIDFCICVLVFFYFTGLLLDLWREFSLGFVVAALKNNFISFI